MVPAYLKWNDETQCGASYLRHVGIVGSIALASFLGLVPFCFPVLGCCLVKRGSGEKRLRAVVGCFLIICESHLAICSYSFASSP